MHRRFSLGRRQRASDKTCGWFAALCNSELPGRYQSGNISPMSDKVNYLVAQSDLCIRLAKLCPTQFWVRELLTARAAGYLERALLLEEQQLEEHKSKKFG